MTDFPWSLLRVLWFVVPTLIGLYIIGINWYRIYAMRRAARDGTPFDSSPSPLVGPIFIALGGLALPSQWWGRVIVIAFVVDCDTWRLLLSLPFLIKQLRKG